MRFILASFLFGSVLCLDAKAQSAPDFCQVLNANQVLVGVATRQGKIAKYLPSQNPEYQVVGLSFSDNSLKNVKREDDGLVLEAMGRTNAVGKIFDYREREIGHLSGGEIYNEFGQLEGYYQGCDDLEFETRNSLLAAAASRLLIFDFGRHAWEYRFFEYCTPQHICLW